MDVLSLYDYDLPADRIAQEPKTPREEAKLMVLPRTCPDIFHNHIKDLPEFLRAGDVIVVNNSKVFNARLIVGITKPDGGMRQGELFLIRPQGDYWQALAKPGKAFKTGNKVTIAHNFYGTIIQQNDDGTVLVDFHLSPLQVIALTEEHGRIPTPPYIKKLPVKGDYQTAYAKIVGSVAAPTAGFHLTPELLHRIKDMGVTLVEITLHVGLGTFLPIRTETIKEHAMHSEWVEITQEAADTINIAKKEKRRVIAIGTTTVRALEGVSRELGTKDKGQRSEEVLLSAFSGDVNLFITPGFQFTVIDGLLTNFHLPKSTLLILVSAFAGYERIKDAYKLAIQENYRFYSFGDAMVII